MGMGYEGLVRLNVDGVNEDMALATGASVPRGRPEIESGSAYGGRISTPIAEIGIGSPHVRDWEVHDGSMDLELTLGFYNNQIKTWIFDRQKDASIELKSRESNVQTFNDCFWSSISIAAQEGGAVTSSISFVSLQRDAYTIGGDYIGNKTGDEVFCTAPAFNVPSPLNLSASSNLSPIPYWNTKVTIGGTEVDFLSWSVDFSQEVVKFFSCETNVSPVEPRYIAVGPMTATFSGEYMFTNTATFAVPIAPATMEIEIGSSAGTPGTLKFEDLELETSTDAIQSADSLTSISIDYKAYTLTV